LSGIASSAHCNPIEVANEKRDGWQNATIIHEFSPSCPAETSAPRDTVGMAGGPIQGLALP